MEATRQRQLVRALELLGVPRDGDERGQVEFRALSAADLRRRMESAARTIAVAVEHDATAARLSGFDPFWREAFLAALSCAGVDAVDAARVADEALKIAQEKGRV